MWMNLQAGINVNSFSAEESWHLWQRTDLNTSHLHLRVPPHHARAGVLISTSERSNLFARHVKFWHFSICYYDHRRWDIHVVLYVNRKKTQIFMYLLWEYFINACTGPVFKNTPMSHFNWDYGLLRSATQMSSGTLFQVIHFFDPHKRDKMGQNISNSFLNLQWMPDHTHSDRLSITGSLII